MKSFAFALVAAASIASAQELYKGVPDCAVNCLKEYISQTSCDIDDAQCQCTDQFIEDITPLVTPCLSDACTGDEIQTALDAATLNCAEIAGGSSSSLTVTDTSTSTSTDTSTPVRVATSAFASSSFIRPGNSTATITSTTSTSTSTTTTGSPTSVDNGSGGSDNDSGTPDDDLGAGVALTPAFGGIAALMLGWLALL